MSKITYHPIQNGSGIILTLRINILSFDVVFSSFEELNRDPDPEDFVLVKFKPKKEERWYIKPIFLRKASKF